MSARKSHKGVRRSLSRRSTKAPKLRKGASASSSKTNHLGRVRRAAANLGSKLPARELGAAASASSDAEILLRILESPALRDELETHDPLAPARLRGVEAARQLLAAEGGTWTAARVGAHLRVDENNVENRRRAGRLIGVRSGKGSYRFPAWQFVPGGTLRGLEQVLEALRAHDPWMQMIFFLDANVRLENRTPLGALREGRVEQVLQAAEAFGVHGAA